MRLLDMADDAIPRQPKVVGISSGFDSDYSRGHRTYV
jgi:hypothetical protein